MNDLVARIRAAIDDHELAATQCQERDWRFNGANSCTVVAFHTDGSSRTIAWCRNGYDDDFSNSIHIAVNDPARVLAMVAAHRLILDEHVAYNVKYAGTPTAIDDDHCIGCGFDASEEYRTEHIGDCPTVLALAAGYGISEEEQP